ncbi:MAG: hypothetical protein A3B70_05005 [Deltaproteobacteria bacterium RIFCSPHIGHO2_02_FULL_40_11]|nr:MAG: hypothetical protein A3B70_05005 [Deltaproteobacteria bacterium RIFCSPHIGHO2_02_FULL_40_11]
MSGETFMLVLFLAACTLVTAGIVHGVTALWRRFQGSKPSKHSTQNVYPFPKENEAQSKKKKAA